MLYTETADSATLFPPDAPLARLARFDGWEWVLHGDGLRSLRGARGTLGRDGRRHRVLLCTRAALVTEGGKNITHSGRRDGRGGGCTSAPNAPGPPDEQKRHRSKLEKEEEEEEERTRQDKKRARKKERKSNDQYHIPGHSPKVAQHEDGSAELSSIHITVSQKTLYYEMISRKPMPCLTRGVCLDPQRLHAMIPMLCKRNTACNV